MALGYLHKSNIYYRDLKPENILLGLDGYILLDDLGLAKINQMQDGAEPNSFCGTPEYISPEMIVGSGHDHTLDWWAYMLVAIVSMIYFSLIAMVMNETTQPLKLMTKQ